MHNTSTITDIRIATVKRRKSNTLRSIYMRVRDFAFCEPEYDEVDMDFCMGGNETNFLQMNEILKKFIPIIKLYREKEIPDEAFQMILNGYLEQLPDK